MTTRERAELDTPDAPAPALPTFVTIDEAAAALGVSYHTVWRRVRSGELPVTRIGRLVRIDVADLGVLRHEGPAPAPARTGRSAAHARRSPRAREPQGEFARRARGLDPAA